MTTFYLILTLVAYFCACVAGTGFLAIAQVRLRLPMWLMIASLAAWWAALTVLRTLVIEVLS